MNSIDKNEVTNAMQEIVEKQFASCADFIVDNYAYQYLADLATEGESKFVARPLCVVLPSTTKEVVKIVKYCNERELEFKAQSTYIS